MEHFIEKEISQDTICQIVEIANDYTQDYFTPNYPKDMKIDMMFQRAVLLKNGLEIVSCIVFTCLDGSPHKQRIWQAINAVFCGVYFSYWIE